MGKSSSIIIGIIIGITTCALLIYAYETDRSFIQIIIGFCILIIPITFISSFNGKFAVFLLSSLLIIGTYLCINQHWYDTVYGVVLALLLGGTLYRFRISKVETFNASDYKKNQKDKRNDR